MKFNEIPFHSIPFIPFSIQGHRIKARPCRHEQAPFPLCNVLKVNISHLRVHVERRNHIPDIQNTLTSSIDCAIAYSEEMIELASESVRACECHKKKTKISPGGQEGGPKEFIELLGEGQSLPMKP
jgi:hypothetical protein